jgi:hypothetical protein
VQQLTTFTFWKIRISPPFFFGLTCSVTLNRLNLQLRGRGKTAVDMVEKLEAFTRKFDDLDFSSGRLRLRTLKNQEYPECVLGGKLRGIERNKGTGILCANNVWINLHLRVLL